MPDNEISTYSREGVTLPRMRFGGYVYVIEFSTGLVKVGKTSDPAKRLETHRGNGAAFGADITRYWVSAAHDNFDSNETLLIQAMRDLGGTSNRAEYFTGVSMEESVAAAKSLTLDEIDTEAHEANIGRATAAIKAALWGDRDPVEEMQAAQRLAAERSRDRFSAIDALFGAVIGSVSNAHNFPVMPAQSVPLSMVRDIADKLGVPVSTVAGMNLIESMQMTVEARVKVAAMQLRIWAIENDRWDLLDPYVVDVSA